MNYIQKNKTFAAREPSPLVRVWRSSGDPGMPLVSTWVRTEFTKFRPTLPTRRAATHRVMRRRASAGCDISTQTRLWLVDAGRSFVAGQFWKSWV